MVICVYQVLDDANALMHFDSKLRNLCRAETPVNVIV
jgi:hypothetical protein